MSILLKKLKIVITFFPVKKSQGFRHSRRKCNQGHKLLIFEAIKLRSHSLCHMLFVSILYRQFEHIL